MQTQRAVCSRYTGGVTTDALEGTGAADAFSSATCYSGTHIRVRAGTADAVRQYMWLFNDSVSTGVEDYIILSGDHLYRCNYMDFVLGAPRKQRRHHRRGAAVRSRARDQLWLDEDR